MKLKQIVILMFGIGSFSAVCASSTFNIGSSAGPIFIEFNTGGGSPANVSGGSVPCTVTPGNPQCCSFGKAASVTGVQISEGEFNISTNQCGSSGGAQAEFNLATSHGDVVDASTMSGTAPNVSIYGPGLPRIDLSDPNSCGVFTAKSTAVGCGFCSFCTPPNSQPSPPKCNNGQAANYCMNFYPAGTAYTVSFGRP